jgi:hypothetical protein
MMSLSETYFDKSSGTIREQRRAELAAFALIFVLADSLVRIVRLRDKEVGA